MPAEATVMARYDEATLRRIAKEAYSVNLSDKRLKEISQLVNWELEALEKSAELGLEDVEPAMKYDPSLNSDE